jgi:hypothetical protein
LRPRCARRGLPMSAEGPPHEPGAASDPKPDPLYVPFRGGEIRVRHDVVLPLTVDSPLRAVLTRYRRRHARRDTDVLVARSVGKRRLQRFRSARPRVDANTHPAVTEDSVADEEGCRRQRHECRGPRACRAPRPCSDPWLPTGAPRRDLPIAPESVSCPPIQPRYQAAGLGGQGAPVSVRRDRRG